MYGLGTVVSLIAKLLLEKEGLEVVGAIDIPKDKVGRDLGLVLGLDRTLRINVSDNANIVLTMKDLSIPSAAIENARKHISVW